MYFGKAPKADAKPSLLNRFRRINVSKEGGPEFQQNVDNDGIHSAAKTCVEATNNGIGHSPRLENSHESLGIGFRTLLCVAPSTNCVHLATIAMFCGSFPPLRWEVSTSRDQRKPLSLSVVPATDCLGSWVHDDWAEPASLDRESDRTLAVPLFAKIGAIYIYSMEEKDIEETMMRGKGTMGMGRSTFVGTGGSAATNMASRRWKFSGVGFGGSVALVSALLMPSTMVDALVTFGTPACVTAPDGLFPFPHTHVQHVGDITPHMLSCKYHQKIIARLQGMGMVFPQPPSALLRYTRKDKELYKHPLVHVVKLYPPPSSLKCSTEVLNMLFPSSSDMGEMGFRGRRSKDADVPPRAELEGRAAEVDLRYMSPYYTVKEYFFSFRLLLGKKMEGVPPLVTPIPEGCAEIVKVMTSAGEFTQKQALLEMIDFIAGPGASAPPPLPPTSPATDALSISQTSAASKTTTVKGKKANTAKEKPVKEKPPERGPKTELVIMAETMFLQFPKLITTAQEAQLPQLPPLNAAAQLSIANQLQLQGDTHESLTNYLKVFREQACWDPKYCARQLLDFASVPPLNPIVAQMFVRAQNTLFLCSKIPKRVPPSRHVSTANALDGMQEETRALLNDPDGYHLSWTVAVASVTRGMGKSTLIRQFTEEFLQTTSMRGVQGDARRDAPKPPTPGEPSEEGDAEKDVEPFVPRDTTMEELGQKFMKIKWAPPPSSFVDRRINRRDPTQLSTHLFKVNLEEVRWGNNTRLSNQRLLSFATEVLWLVQDQYTFEQFVNHEPISRTAPKEKAVGGGFMGYIHVLVYCPRKGTERNSFLEGYIADYCNQVGIPYVATELTDGASVAALQRLLVQFMLPKLKLPIDPRLLPPNVEVGALLTKSDTMLHEYLVRTAPLVHKATHSNFQLDYEDIMAHEKEDSSPSSPEGAEDSILPSARDPVPQPQDDDDLPTAGDPNSAVVADPSNAAGRDAVDDMNEASLNSVSMKSKTMAEATSPPRVRRSTRAANA